MGMQKYESLKLDRQLCFPLYACSREVIKQYRPYLDVLDLTYTQYITMMVLWEKKQSSIKELGKRLYLDSGTLTPVLKSLEAKGYVNRSRSTADERVLLVQITPEGKALRDKAVEIPGKLAKCVKLEANESLELYRLLHKLLDGVQEN